MFIRRLASSLLLLALSVSLVSPAPVLADELETLEIPEDDSDACVDDDLEDESDVEFALSNPSATELTTVGIEELVYCPSDDDYYWVLVTPLAPSPQKTSL